MTGIMPATHLQQKRSRSSDDGTTEPGDPGDPGSTSGRFCLDDWMFLAMSGFLVFELVRLALKKALSWNASATASPTM